jgi:hypothetical protein
MASLVKVSGPPSLSYVGSECSPYAPHTFEHTRACDLPSLLALMAGCSKPLSDSLAASAVVS